MNMKKNNNSNTKTITRARSKSNGIIFYSRSLPIGVETFRDENGEIQKKIMPEGFDELFEWFENSGNTNRYINRSIVVLCDMILISLSIFSKNIVLILAAIYWSLFASMDSAIFIQNAFEMKLPNGKSRSLGRFHAAEHMAINAYESLQRIPTLEEIKKASRFSSNCGCTRMCFKLSFFTLITVALVVSSKSLIAYLIILTGIVIFMILAKPRGWLNFLQIFFTSKPTDYELEVAIQGLRNLEEFESQLESDFEIVFGTNFPKDFQDFRS